MDDTDPVSDDEPLAEKAEFESLCEQLRRNESSLHDVEVGWESLVLNEAHLKELADALRLHRIGSIKHLRLSQIQIQGRKVATNILAPALKNLSALESLQLTDCQDNEHLADAIGVALFYNKSISSLHCSNCWKQPKSVAAMSSLVHSARNLTQLRLCHNRIDAKAARIMAQGLRRHSALRDLDLTGNQMDDKAIAAFARGLHGHACRIRSLILDFNAFGDDGVLALAKFLTKNKSLVELHLFGNRVSCTGAEYLAESLHINACLQSLILSFNQIGDRGAVALAQALTVNTTLTKIWFPSNSIGNEGMLTFAEHLPNMKGLEQLDVGLLLYDEAAKALAKAVQCNMRLSVLRMEQVPEEETEQETARKMDFYLRLNRSGRRLLRNGGGTGGRKPETQIPLGLWPHVLANSVRHGSPSGAPDVLHYWLRAKPELLDISSRSETDC